MKRSAAPISPGPCKSPRLVNNDSNESRIKVCVRVRPFNQKESEAGCRSIIDVVDENILIFDPSSYEPNDQYHYHGKIYKEIGKKANKNMQFVFDRVFNDSENNIAVYSETTKDLVSSLLSGFNCSVFAYGSTGSGKTHTMLGSSDDPGVIFFTTMDLYKQLDEEKNKNLELSISYFEIYNEVIYDLLDPASGQPLSVLEDANKNVTVKNLSVHQPTDANHLLQMLEVGNKNRKQHPTDANSESSRSHAIFQITLKRKEYSNYQDMSIQVSKMSLIDLAGSERASVAYKTYRSNGLHREGGNINKSLLSLGNCINALTGNKKSGYVPYRSSKLTMILRDSLGGNCQTLMIATVSQSSNQYEEIHNTLLYAERAKGVQLNVRKNNILINAQTRDYKVMYERLCQEKSQLLNENNSLKNKIASLENRFETIPDNPITSADDAVDKLNSVKNLLDDLFKKRIELRAKLLDCEHKLKLLDLRLLFRTYDNQRIKILEGVGYYDQENLDEPKSVDALHSIYNQKLHYADIKLNVQKEVQQNEMNIQKIEKDLIDKTNNDFVVQSYFNENNSICRSHDIESQEKHYNKIVEEICKKFGTYDELTTETINFVYKAYHILNGLNQLSEDMENRFKNIIQKMKGKKNVIWPDNVDSPKLNKLKDFVSLFSLPIYKGLSETPEDKRNLVFVRDITPKTKNNSFVISRTTPEQYGAIQKNGNTHTVTKSRSVAIVQPETVFKENHFYTNNNNNYKSPRNYNQSSIPQSSGWHKNYRSNRFNRHNNGQYAYNPNFRPKFRF